MAYKEKAEAIKYNNEFNKKAYDRINLLVPKGHKDIIKAAADKSGESVNEYIKGAIADRLGRDGYSISQPSDNSIS